MVDFPPPEGPINAITSPAFTLKLILSKTKCSPNFLVIFLSSKIIASLTFFLVVLPIGLER